MSDSLSETEINNLKKTFTAIDVNGDGVITVTEMKNAIDQWGNDVKVKADHENLLKLMKVADVNGDGQLSYEELLMTCVQRKLNNKEERYVSLVTCFLFIMHIVVFGKRSESSI